MIRLTETTEVDDAPHACGCSHAKAVVNVDPATDCVPC
jgi:hypothetical protein